MIKDVKVVYDSKKGVVSHLYAIIDGVPKFMTNQREIKNVLMALKVQEGANELSDISQSKYLITDSSDIDTINAWDKEYGGLGKTYMLNKMVEGGLSLNKKSNHKSIKGKIVKYATGIAAAATIITAIPNLTACGKKNANVTEPTNVETTTENKTEKPVTEPVKESSSIDRLNKILSNMSNYSESDIEKAFEAVMNDESIPEVKRKAYQATYYYQDAFTMSKVIDGKEVKITPNPNDLVDFYLISNASHLSDVELAQLFNGNTKTISDAVNSYNRIVEFYTMKVIDCYSNGNANIPVILSVDDDVQDKFFNINKMAEELLNANNMTERQKISAKYEKMVSDDVDGFKLSNSEKMIYARFANITSQFYNGTFSKGTLDEWFGDTNKNPNTTTLISNGCSDMVAARERFIEYLNRNITKNEKDYDLAEWVEALNKRANYKNLSYDNGEILNSMYKATIDAYNKARQNSNNVNNINVNKNKTPSTTGTGGTGGTGSGSHTTSNTEEYSGGDSVGDIMGGDNPADIDKMKQNVENTSNVVTDPNATLDDILKTAQEGLGNATDPADKGYQQSVIDGAVDGQDQANKVINEYNNAVETGKDSKGNNVLDAKISTGEHELPITSITTDEIAEENKNITTSVDTIDNSGTITGGKEEFTYDQTNVVLTDNDYDQTDEAINNRHEIEEDDEPEIEIVDYEDIAAQADALIEYWENYDFEADMGYSDSDAKSL